MAGIRRALEISKGHAFVLFTSFYALEHAYKQLAGDLRKAGITPLKQRSGLGNYKIAVYETLLQSVIAYMHNLNTHHAYKKLRARRAELRMTGAKVTGWDLVSTLTKYSERGQAYVDSLRALIKVNMLQPVDDAYLGNGPTILLIQVGDNANRIASR